MNTKIKVLMVDDEEQFRATTRKILERRGFETILAASGEEAIVKLEEQPDVIVLDIKMPGMDGLEALKIIHEKIPEVPVVMLTGHGSEASARDALDKGAFDYLSKPCDIDLLSAKIMDAHRHGPKHMRQDEKLVADIMIPLADYTTLGPNNTVREAVAALKETFQAKASTSRIMETGHRSVLIMDAQGRMQGILTIIDLLRELMPHYLFVPKPSLADAVQYSPMFWKGMFSRNVAELGRKKIMEIMSPAPLTIEYDANLMEAAYAMMKENARRLAVVQNGEVVGIIREQDLFFEIEMILSAKP